MNLDLVPLGWVHLLASLIALVLFALIVLRPKGTAVHRRRGRLYAAALAVTAVTALGLYRRGIFFFPHWLALASLLLIAVGVAAAHYKIPHRHWPHLHVSCMGLSGYVLVGGGVNEVFLRIEALRRLAPRVDSPAVGLTHLCIALLFIALVAYFNVAILRQARTFTGAPRDTLGPASPLP